MNQNIDDEAVKKSDDDDEMRRQQKSIRSPELNPVGVIRYVNTK